MPTPHERMHRRARATIAIMATVGAAFGAVFAGAAAFQLAHLALFDPGLWAVAGGLVGGLAGVSVGESRAAALRVRAHEQLTSP